jgi:hypothetical protein
MRSTFTIPQRHQCLNHAIVVQILVPRQCCSTSQLPSSRSSLLRLLRPILRPTRSSITNTTLSFISHALNLFFPLSKLTKSIAPLTKWYLTPGQSWLRPPLTSTTLCCCTLCPSPGIYAVTTLPVLNRTLATFRSAELGFFGFVVPTLRQTPLSSGAMTSRRAGETAWRARCCFRQPWK